MILKNNYILKEEQKKEYLTTILKYTLQITDSKLGKMLLKKLFNFISTLVYFKNIINHHKNQLK